MTVTATAIFVDYVTDGAADEYALPFAFISGDHVKVYLDGVLQTAGYTITGAGNPSGGTLVFDVAPVTAQALRALRQTPLTQEIEVLNNSAVFAETLEQGLDYAVLRAQEAAYYSGTTALEEVLELRDEVVVLAAGADADATQTAADRVQTGLDAAAAAASAAAADADATAITALVINGHQGFATKAAMDADLAWAAGTVAEVYDSDPALAGIYIKSGASGAGSWGSRVYQFTTKSLQDQLDDINRNLSVNDHLERAPRIGVIGDSIQQDNGQGRATADLIQTNARGELVVALALNPRAEFTIWADATKNANATLYYNGGGQGVNGNSSAQALARAADLYSQAMDIAIVSVGVNDIVLYGGTAAVAMANITALVRALTKRGVKVILTNVRPVGTGSLPNPSTARTEMIALNAAIPVFAASEPMVWFCDLHSVYESGDGVPGGTPISGMYYDNIHPDDIGAWSLGGPKINTVLDEIIKGPPTALPIITRQNNLWPNPYFETSGGVASTGFSGGSAGVALNWRVTRVGSSPTGVVSLVPNAETDGNSQRIVITPSGVGPTDAIQFRLSADVIDATPYVGRWVRGYAVVSLSDWAYWRGVQLVMARDGAVEIMKGNALRSLTVSRLPATGLTGKLYLPFQPFLVPVGMTQFNPTVDIRIDGAGTGTGTVDIHQMALAVVPDPRR